MMKLLVPIFVAAACAASTAAAAAPASTNVAAASAGAIASASSTLGSCGGPGSAGYADCPPYYFTTTSLNDGERAGVNWGNYAGWADASPDLYPDWVQIDFNGTKQVDRVVVYTVQDNWQAPVEPTDAMTFTQFGVQDFDVQGWDGSQWVVLASVRGNNLVKRTVTFAAFATNRIRVSISKSLASLSRLTEVEAWGVPAPEVTNASINVADSARGASVVASSTFPGFDAATVIQDHGLLFASPSSYPTGSISPDQNAFTWGRGGGWADGTVDRYPDWLEVRFAGIHAIDHVTLYTLPDDYGQASSRPDWTLFTKYGITDFSVQAWNGVDWLTVGSVMGNRYVKRNVAFPAIATDRIRVLVFGALNGLARITGVEAWTAAPRTDRADYALATNGATVRASSQLGPDFPAQAMIDGDRAGRGWGAGGGWANWGDSQPWVEVQFDGVKSIDQVVVSTLQDAWQDPVEPSDTMTFTRYGLQSYNVYASTGTSWVQVASVSGNNFVKRTISFAPVATDRIRIETYAYLGGFARITELEAWGVPLSSFGRNNVALASAGGTATASSTLAPEFPASAVIDGERAGMLWTDGGGWADATFNQSPDAVAVDFNGVHTIDKVSVYTLQDDWQYPQQPDPYMTMSQWGISDFTVEAFDGSSWVTVGTVAGNTNVMRTVTFPPIAASSVRVTVTNPRMSLSRITEIEAWEHVDRSCAAAPPGTVDFTLPSPTGGAPQLVALPSGVVGSALLPPIPYGSVHVGAMPGTSAPTGGIMEVTLSPCRGSIEPAAGACYLLDDGVFYSGWTYTDDWHKQTTPGWCIVDPDQPYYLNVRYLYQPAGCPSGTCGATFFTNY